MIPPGIHKTEPKLTVYVHYVKASALQKSLTRALEDLGHFVECHSAVVVGPQSWTHPDPAAQWLLSANLKPDVVVFIGTQEECQHIFSTGGPKIPSVIVYTDVAGKQELQKPETFWHIGWVKIVQANFGLARFRQAISRVYNAGLAYART